MRLLSDEEILPQVASLGGAATVGVRTDLLSNADCGPPLRAYLALTHGAIGDDLTPADRLCNRYFFFLRFARAYHARFGPDAGIDQQAGEILSSANWDELGPVNVEQVEALAAAH